MLPERSILIRQKLMENAKILEVKLKKVAQFGSITVVATMQYKAKLFQNYSLISHSFKSTVQHCFEHQYKNNQGDQFNVILVHANLCHFGIVC